MNTNVIIALPILNNDSSDLSQISSVKTKWMKTLDSLLRNQRICGICLSRKDDLISLDHVYDKEHVVWDNDNTFRCMITSAFGFHVQELLPSTYISEDCSNSILQAYSLIQQINSNYKTLLAYSELIEHQINLHCKEDVNEIVQQRIQSKVERPSKKPVYLDNKIICPLCNKMLKYNLYSKHYEKKHSKEKVYKCCLCMNILYDLQLLVEHRKVEHNENVCKICYTIINIGLDEHIEMYHSDKALKCDKCAKSFDKTEKLEKHFLQHESANIVCQHCLKVFTNEGFKSHKCIYKCDECVDRSCVHKEYLLFYRDQHTMGKKLFSCNDCDYNYKKVDEIIAHANETHLSHYPHICKNCGEQYASVKTLQEHTNSMHKETDVKINKINRPYKCEVCELRFKFKENVITHKKTHWKCKYCNKYFKSRGVLNHHVKEFHKINLVRVYKCTMCPEDYHSKKKYQEHLGTHPKDSRHVCRECGASFLSKINYITHYKKHTLLKDVECALCHKLYNKYAIKRHYMLVHEKIFKQPPTKSNKCVCDECGKMLASQAALNRHRITHKPVRVCPFCSTAVSGTDYKIHAHTCKSRTKTERLKKLQCPHCDYSVSDKVCLVAHTNRYHLKVRPFQCDVCKKSFFSSLTLKEHTRIHLGEKPEQCALCGNRFVSKKALMLHTRIHTGEKPYSCDLCEEKFLSASRRQSHRIRKHFEPTLQCSLCTKKCYTNTCLRRHMNKCHSGNKTKGNAADVDKKFTKLNDL